MALPRHPAGRDDFTIGIICALSLEAEMVELVFDKRYGSERGFGRAHGDTNTYTTGVMAGHNVVLAYCPGMGVAAAATAASNLQRSYPAVQVLFVVGICGAVPFYKRGSEIAEIVLGDCIISTDMVQSDFGRIGPAGQSRKGGFDAAGRAATIVRSLQSKLQTVTQASEMIDDLKSSLDILLREQNICYPGAQQDRLYEASYVHTHEVCSECEPNLGLCKRDCADIGCKEAFLVPRARLEEDASPRIHFGVFSSSNSVIKSGQHRDAIAKEGVIAFEMEGAGVWEVLPTIIIKAACDYADSHKNKIWQSYAAATAAAALKAVLKKWEVTDDEILQETRYDVPFSLQGVPVSKKFVDRPLQIQDMEKTLLPKPPTTNQQRIFVLHGLGGIGKTQLAVQFMRLHRARFSAVFWLDGSSKDSLERSIAGCAARIPADQISEVSREYAHSGGNLAAVVQDVLQWFSRSGNERWLMVIDNADREWPSTLDPLAYDIKAYIPTVDHGSVLVTSRLVRLGQIGESCEISRVEIDTARAVLDTWYKKPYDPTEAYRLLEHLDGLPLAIAQAGAFLQESGMDMGTYLQLYEQQQQDITKLLHGADAPLQDYPNRSVWTTWNISYEAILAQDEHTAHLLILWSFLNRNDLWYGMFEKAGRWNPFVTEILSEWIGSIAKSEASFHTAMGLLRSYSLLEGSEGAGGYSLHTVVHRWAYFYQGLRHMSRVGRLAIILVGAAVPETDERDSAWLQRRLLPHAQLCSSKIPDTESELVTVTSRENQNQRLQDLRWDEDLLYAYHNLALLYREQGRLIEAEAMYRRVLQGKEDLLGPKHVSTLITVHSLGNLYHIQSKVAEAEGMYLRALHGYEEALAPMHIHTLGAINNLGIIYEEQGKVEEAEAMYLRALHSMEEALGPKHIHTLMTVQNLSNLFLTQGKLVEAETLCLRVLHGREEALGPEHTLTLESVGNLGTIYKDQGKMKEAEAMYLRALKGYNETLGFKHVETYIPCLRNLFRLGDLYSEGKPDKAREMYTKALAGYEVALGPSSNHCLLLRQRLARLDSRPKPPLENADRPGVGAEHLIHIKQNKTEEKMKRGFRGWMRKVLK